MSRRISDKGELDSDGEIDNDGGEYNIGDEMGKDDTIGTPGLVSYNSVSGGSDSNGSDFITEIVRVV
jgi:hypothetical protein